MERVQQFIKRNNSTEANWSVSTLYISPIIPFQLSKDQFAGRLVNYKNKFNKYMMNALQKILICLITIVEN